MKLGKDWDKRHLILFGDGLSQVRARSFNNLITDSSNHFGTQQTMSTVLKKALSRVVHVTGDLHGSNFHFLSAVYTMLNSQVVSQGKYTRGQQTTKRAYRDALKRTGLFNEKETSRPRNGLSA